MQSMFSLHISRNLERFFVYSFAWLLTFHQRACNDKIKVFVEVQIFNYLDWFDMQQTMRNKPIWTLFCTLPTLSSELLITPIWNPCCFNSFNVLRTSGNTAYASAVVNLVYNALYNWSKLRSKSIVQIIDFNFTRYISAIRVIPFSVIPALIKVE